VTRPGGAVVPDDLPVTTVAREPVWDSTLGIVVDNDWQGEPPHRLVSIGDSLTQGFMSGAVYATDLSYPAMIAHELGWSGLRYPRYGGPGGLPLNIELLLRELDREFGPVLDWWQLPLALFRARAFADIVEDYWERGTGALPPPTTAIKHVLAVFGWDLRDALERTAKSEAETISRPTDDLVRQLVEHANARAALRVLPPGEQTVFDAAIALGEERGSDPEHGIETLVVFLGANNALDVVTELRVAWSGPGYDDLARKGAFTVWRPEHFAAELRLVVERVRAIRARHVIWCTVPHVTIAPIARGVGKKVTPGSRYFPYYTRPWITDRDFNPNRDPHITAAEARVVDSAIDEYNDAITAAVGDGRRDGRDWYLLDIAGVLDRLASRRYLEDAAARPPWWRPYPLPPELAALRPLPDSRFITSSGVRRTSGGLFSLDGVHPTTVGYGIIAQELVNVMLRAGVQFRLPNEASQPAPVRVDFTRLIRRDTLLTRPPANILPGLQVLGWVDEVLGLFGHSLSL